MNPSEPEPHDFSRRPRPGGFLRSATMAVGFALAALATSMPTQASSQADPGAADGRAAGEEARALGGSSSVGAQLETDDRATAPAVLLAPLERYDVWLRRQHGWLEERIGLAVAADYNALGQGATRSLDRDGAAGGVFRVYGTWEWPGDRGKNRGSLTFKVENRHRYTQIAPQRLSTAVGSTALTAATWSDAGWLLSNLFWYQQWLDDRLSFAAGILDVTDYVDVYGLVNPWTDFMSSVFLTNATIAAPNQGLGLAARVSVTDHVYVLAGLADANGDPSDPLDNFDTFFDDHEFFEHLEVGWASSWDRRQKDNVHLTVWHADTRSEADLPSGWGVAFSANHLFGDRWLPFVRAGWSDGGGGAPLEASVAVGLGCYSRDESDLLAVGIHWGRPSSETLGSGLHDEYGIELLWRIHVIRRLSITPDVQLRIDPALHPGADVVGVFGLRIRNAF